MSAAAKSTEETPRKFAWASAPLREVCDFHNGLWTGKKEPFETANVIRNTNFTADGRIDLSDVAVLEVESRQFAKRRLQRNDVIIEKSGGGPKQPVGRVVLFELDAPNYSFSNFTSAIRVKNVSTLDPVYLHRVLYWWYVNGRTEPLQRRSTGIRNLDFEAYKDLEVPLPPLEEQRRIVAVLDEALEGLARARENAEANVQNAREAFRTSLAMRTNSEEFPRMPLSKICDVRDGTHDSPKYVENGVPLVTQKNIRPEGLSLEDVKLISQDDHLAIHKRSNVAQGDILISMIGVNRGMSCIVDRADVFSIKNVGLVKSTLNLNMDFLLFYLQSADAERYVEAATNGGAQPFVGLGKLRAFPIPVPERDRQNQIASELLEIREAVALVAQNYRLKLQSLDALRQSLLQKAFSGELT